MPFCMIHLNKSNKLFYIEKHIEQAIVANESLSRILS